MIEQLGILSDNYYKYLTSLSVIVLIYCTSFSTLFIKPYNDSTFEVNKRAGQLDAQRGMLQGIRDDLLSQIKDTSTTPYYYYYAGRSDLRLSDSINKENRYYYTAGLDSTTKAIVDSLNKVYFQILSDKIEIKEIKYRIGVEYRNLLRRRNIYWALGILSLLTFIFGMYKWNKFRKVIDKKK